MNSSNLGLFSQEKVSKSLYTLIDFNVLLNTSDEKFETALLQKENLVNARTKQNITLLHHAIKYHAVTKQGEDKVEILLECGANVHAKDDSGRSALHIALQLKDISIFLMLFKVAIKNPHFDINQQDDNGNTLLQLAAALSENFYGDDEESIIGKIFAYGADLNITNHLGFTPLITAIENRNYYAAVLLVRNGADPENEMLVQFKMNLNRKISALHLLDEYISDKQMNREFIEARVAIGEKKIMILARLMFVTGKALHEYMKTYEIFSTRPHPQRTKLFNKIAQRIEKLERSPYAYEADDLLKILKKCANSARDHHKKHNSFFGITFTKSTLEETLNNVISSPLFKPK